MISKNYAYAFLAGITAGAVAAAIYTPYSGEATRKRIRQGIEDAGNSLTDAGEYLRGQADRLNAQAQTAIAHTQGQVQDVLDQAATAVNTTLKQAADAFAAQSGQASNVLQTVIDVANGRPLH